MIKLTDLYSLIEETFVYLMVVTDNEQVVYCSPLLKLRPNTDPSNCPGNHLSDLLTPGSLASFRQAMADVRQGTKGIHALLSSREKGSPHRPMTVAHLNSGDGDLFLFFGAQLDTLSKLNDWEKEERIKELSCLYSVAEWIEASPSVNDFFIKLPEHLARGMRYPEETLVCPVYNGVEYGQKPAGDQFLKVDLTINGEVRGR